MIDYGSVCSGIESVSVAVHPLGWTPAWLSEIEPFPCAVLEHRLPDVPNHGDMTLLPAKVLRGEIPAPAVLVGGTPCQAFSVAGMRQGLIDPRGALTIKFVELADAIDHVRYARGDAESIVWWENVPGVLSDKSNAFGCFLAALVGESEPLQPSGGRWTDAGCVYGPQRAAAWRILDAQYFGLAQRRRRVFVVASARKGFDPASVLFESEGVRRDIAPRRGEGQDVATEPALRTFSGNQEQPIASTLQTTCDDYSRADSFNMVVHGTQDPNTLIDLAHTLGRNHGQENAIAYSIRTANTSSNGWGIQEDVTHTLDTAQGLAVCIASDITHTLKGEGFDGSEDGTGRGQPIVAAGCLTPFLPQRARIHSVGGVAPTLSADEGRGHGVPSVFPGSAVRRLTPRECEHLQGFPDGWTQIPWRNKPADECPDGPRYKAIGNSKAVPVVRWIARRIQTHI